MLRLTAASIDRTIETENMPCMDENGKDLSPKKHDIVFDHVSFSYEQKTILHDISVTLPVRQRKNHFLQSYRAFLGR